VQKDTQPLPGLAPVRAAAPRPAAARDARKWLFMALALAAMLALAAGTALLGAYRITIEDVWRVVAAHLFGGDLASLDRVYHTIVWEIRLPRIALVIVAGVAISSSGAVYQGAFRNPLVEPFILGVSAGASLGAALGIVFPQFFLSVQAGAFVFALLAVALAYWLARVEGKTPVVTLILAGVIISALFQSVVSIMKYVSDDQALRAIVFWTMGGFYYASWRDVTGLTPWIAACFAVLWFLGWRLNVLSMGDEEARSLGVDPDRLKLILIVLSTLMTALAVSAAGIISWIGLMIPHATRMILGPDNRFVIPASGVLGAALLLVCDTIARTLTTAEIPIGIIISIIGAPYLFYLLRSKGRYTLGG
jgi:iron complex transport system permease protein